MDTVPQAPASDIAHPRDVGVAGGSSGPGGVPAPLREVAPPPPSQGRSYQDGGLRRLRGSGLQQLWEPEVRAAATGTEAAGKGGLGAERRCRTGHGSDITPGSSAGYPRPEDGTDGDGLRPKAAGCVPAAAERPRRGGS
eukprot:g20894.t1